MPHRPITTRIRRSRCAAPVLLSMLAVSLVGCGGAGVGSDGPPTTPTPAAGPVLYENARLFLGDGRVIESGVLLVRGERIVDVGEAGTVDVPQDARRVDLSDRTVLPALIDAHVHLGYEGYEGWGARYYSRDNLIDHLHRYAYYGFGAVFSAGSDPDELALQIQGDQQAGRVAGARLTFGAGLAPPGQGPNDLFLEHTASVSDRTGVPVVRGAATPRQARDAVREIASKGVPVVKIWVDDRGGSQEKMSPEVYRAVVEEAHDLGLEVFVHQQSAGDMPELVAAGADGFLHGRLGPDLTTDVARALAEADAFVVPNLGLAELRAEPIGQDPFLRETLPSSASERLSSRPNAFPAPESREAGLSGAMQRLIDAGVRIVLGTDAGAIPDHPFGYTGHRELEIFVRLGMTPAQALEAATGTAAAALGLSDAGLLAPNRRADFIVLEANPLDDIRNTRRIADVYLGGTPVDREGLRDGWTRPE